MTADLESRRLAVRRRALANFLLGLLDLASRTAGRLSVESAPDVIILRYAGIRTLVKGPAGFTIDTRDFVVLVAFPSGWPFERREAPIPIVLAPDDFAAPNSDGRLICLDCQGVTPLRLATLVYDNLTLRARRLDHPVSATAADYVRAHLPGTPADSRPLIPAGTMSEAPVAEPDADESGVVTVTPGVLGLALPAISGPVVLRLGRPVGEPVDSARASYLRAAASSIRSGTPIWRDGPALAVGDGDVDQSLLHAEIRELGRTLDALAEPEIALSFLDLCRLETP